MQSSSELWQPTADGMNQPSWCLPSRVKFDFKDQIITLDVLEDLDAMIAPTIHTDRRIFDREKAAIQTQTISWFTPVTRHWDKPSQYTVFFCQGSSTSELYATWAHADGLDMVVSRGGEKVSAGLMYVLCSIWSFPRFLSSKRQGSSVKERTPVSRTFDTSLSRPTLTIQLITSSASISRDWVWSWHQLHGFWFSS